LKAETRESDDMQNNRTALGKTMIYQIRIKGRLSDQWSEWFQGLSIMPADDSDTFLIGPVADQAALFGLLRKVRDLGMPLLSVNRIEGDTSTDPGTGGTDVTTIKKQEKGVTK
jgi:hypothetical protein